MLRKSRKICYNFYIMIYIEIKLIFYVNLNIFIVRDVYLVFFIVLMWCKICLYRFGFEEYYEKLKKYKFIFL